MKQATGKGLDMLADMFGVRRETSRPRWWRWWWPRCWPFSESDRQLRQRATEYVSNIRRRPGGRVVGAMKWPIALLLLAACSGSVAESPCPPPSAYADCDGPRATAELPGWSAADLAGATAEGQTYDGPWVPLEVAVADGSLTAECYDVAGAQYVSAVRFAIPCGE